MKLMTPVDRVLDRLRWGDSIVLGDGHDAHPCMVRLMGINRGQGLIVSVPDLLPMATLADGRKLNCRGFASCSVVSFKTRVVQVCDKPFPYWYLEYPDEAVQSIGNRLNGRLSSDILATVISPRLPEKSAPVFVTDISIGGCRARTRKSLGQPGDKVTLELWANQFDLPAGKLVLGAEIKGCSDHYGKRLGDDLHVGYNLKFTDLTERGRVLMQAILYHIDKALPVQKIESQPSFGHYAVA